MKKQTGFSLIELLAVMALLGLLMALVAPAVVTVMQGNQTTRASDSTVAHLSQARQRALTGNHPVEVRFYQYQSNGSDEEYFKAMQTFAIDDDGAATPMGRSEVLPGQIIIDSGTTLSSLIARLPEKTLDPKIKIPQADINYTCRAFRFLPDGSATSGNAPGLSKTDKWFLTLHSERDGDGLTEPPDNYVTIQIDPANGSIKVWRP